MSDLNQPSEFLPVDTSKPKLPGSINVLTILTFIGCAIGICFTLYGFVSAKTSLDKMEETINSPAYETMPAFAKKFLNPEAVEMQRKMYENRVPMTLIGVVGIALCLYGAVQMRKLKMQGYYMYLIGELLPFVPSIIFIGMGALTGVGGIIAIVITLLFVFLYTGQRKYFVN